METVAPGVAGNGSPGRRSRRCRDLAGARAAGQPLPADPFRLGVASGFPTDDSIVLWTRLAPDPLAPDGGMPPLDWHVSYEVAADENFRRRPRGGTGNRVRAVCPQRARGSGRPLARPPILVSIHRRRATQRHWANAHPARCERGVAELRLAVACCQHYEHGHFSASSTWPPTRRMPSCSWATTSMRAPQPRNRVRAAVAPAARWRTTGCAIPSTSSIRAAGRPCSGTLAVTWDDHEVANDYSGPQRPRRRSRCVSGPPHGGLPGVFRAPALAAFSGAREAA